MEKSKDFSKKIQTDVFQNRKPTPGRMSYVRNTSVQRNENKSYPPRAKNVSVTGDKKYNFYGGDVKSYVKNPPDKTSMRNKSHYMANPSSVSSTVEMAQFDPNADFSGSFSFAAHPAFCSFTFSEFSHYSQYVGYPQTQHYDFSSRQVKCKPKGVITEQRIVSSKIPNPHASFNNQNYLAAMPNSTFRFFSKAVPQKFTNSDAFYKTRMNTAINDQYNSAYAAYASSLPKDGMKLTDLPVYINTVAGNESSMSSKGENEETFPKKQRKYPSKYRPSVTSNMGQSSTVCDVPDQSVFPALSATHSQSSACANLKFRKDASLENNATDETNNEVDSHNTFISTTHVSYADVIRMSNSCNNVIESEFSKCDKSKKSATNLKNNNQNEINTDKTIGTINTNEILSISKEVIDSSCVSEENRASTLNAPDCLEEATLLDSNLQDCKNILSAVNTQNTSSLDKKYLENIFDSPSEKNSDEFSSLASTNRSSLSSDFTTGMPETQLNSAKADSVYSSPSSVSSFGDAFKSVDNRDPSIDMFAKSDLPVIIMNHLTPSGNIADISFGIEYEEIVKLCSDNSNVKDKVVSDSCFISDEGVSDSLSTENDAESLVATNVKESKECGVHIKGKHYRWEETDVLYNEENYMQLAEYLTEVWCEIENETDDNELKNRNVWYFHDL